MSWFSANKLSLSLAKSNFIIFHGKKKNPAAHIQAMSIGSETITRTKSFKYIGVTLDEKLTWNDHINNICSSLQPFFGIFYNIRNYINKPIARSLYFATIYLRIKYGIEVFGCASLKSLNKLQVMQNKLMKILLRKEKTTSTNELHRDLSILKVEDIYKISILSFVHDNLNNDPIAPFCEYFKYRRSTHMHETRGRNDLECPKIKTEIGRGTIKFQGCTLWNSLPGDQRNITYKRSFVKQTTKSLLDSYTSV